VEKKDSVQVIERKFGIPVDSFAIFSDQVERNQFLATILSKYHTDPQQIATLAAKSKDVFDIRNIRAGNHYTVFCTPDSLQKACYFVYQPNPIDYIVYDLRDSVRIYQGKKPVTTQRKETAGIINSSLFESLDNAGASPALAMKMADIYAWDVDFYSIQKGDRFKVIYEEQYVDDLPIGIGTIQSAVFNHDGETFYAFRFRNDSTGEYEYYDEKGKSLRKAFLKAPLKFFRITSHYTRRRFHPIQHRWKAHLGTDYAAPTGTPIMSTAAGVVIASQYTRFNGNYVKVRHNSVYTTQYLHMSKRAVRVGQHVRQGQIIGYVGSTGLATGPHVCYRFWKNGKQVNPLTQKFPAANPIPDEDREAFAQVVEQQKLALSAMSLDTTLLASAE
jgi:murein DD-endopeptidase MepM/ murein hydrolase activator NlpD